MPEAQSVQVFGKWVKKIVVIDMTWRLLHLPWSEFYLSADAMIDFWSPCCYTTSYDRQSSCWRNCLYFVILGRRPQPPLLSQSKVGVLSRSMVNLLRTLSLRSFAWRFSSPSWLLDKISLPIWISASESRVEVSPLKFTPSEPLSPSPLLLTTQSTWMKAPRMKSDPLCLTMTDLCWFLILVDVNLRSMVDAVLVPDSKNLIVRLIIY